MIGGLILALSAAAQEVPVTEIPVDGAPVAVRSWLVSDLFPSPPAKNPPPGGPMRDGYDRDYLGVLGGEAAARPQAGAKAPLPEGGEAAFNPREWAQAYIDLNEIHEPMTDVLVYLYAEIESAAEQTVFIHAGTNSDGKVWVDGRLIVAYPDDRVAMPSQHVVKVVLKKGRTPVLLKIDHDGGGWGAFFEVYGRSAHRAFVEENFPRQLSLEADSHLPMPGAETRIHIGNWIPLEPPAPVSWALRDGDRTERIPGEEADAAVTIPAGPERIVIVSARVEHPQGGEAAGECTLLVGGQEAGVRILADFQGLQAELHEPREMQGIRRDAFALALYQFERIQRDCPSLDLARMRPQTEARLAALRVALGQLEAEEDPYAGKTGRFEGAYLSRADGTAQPFTLTVPATFAPDHPYALQVYLHGAGQIHEAPAGWWQPPIDAPFASERIGVAVAGRGRFTSYAGLGEDDVLQVIEWVEAHYPIDPDRVYIQGFEHGGRGLLAHGRAQYPERFAALTVDCGWPPLGLLTNLWNVPTYVNQGEVDYGIVAQARLGVRTMRDLALPVVYTEFPGVDHAVGVVATPRGYLKHMAPHRRAAGLPRVRIRADHPRHAMRDWAGIIRWQDPHQPAGLEVQVLPDDVVSIAAENVAEAWMAPPAEHLGEGAGIVWICGGKRIETEKSPAGYDLLITEEGPEVRAHV